MLSQQRSLDRLGVVDASDREGVTAAMDAGALAAKITGAGCGGTLLALVTEETTSAVATAWGPDSLPVQIG